MVRDSERPRVDPISAAQTKQGTSAAVTIFPGPEAAFLLPFHSPATMDNRVVRLNGVLGFVISAATCVFANQSATQWVVSQLLSILLLG